MSTVKLMNYQWSDNPREVDYAFPDSWDVTIHHIAGWQRPVLTPAQIKDALAAPIGSSRIKDLARGKKKVCVLFDDLARGTPANLVAPHILAELHEAGVPDNAIEFICAQACHQPWPRSLLAKKIGDDIIKNYKVYNHAAFMNFTPLGKTSYGSKVEINSEVMSCDLKIAIGGCVPHGLYGFAGGAKIIMPGVSSYESIRMHHLQQHTEWGNRLKTQLDTKGVYDGNPRVKDAMEFARMAGLNFSINCILNEKAQIVAVFAGDVEKAHADAVAFAKGHYVMPDMRDNGNDIVVSNAYCKSLEATHATISSFMALKRTGGTSVTIANTPLGQIVHYLFGSGLGFAPHGGGGRTMPQWVNHCVFYTEFQEAKTTHSWKDQDKVSLPDKWSDVIEMLKKWHGNKAKVAVLPDGTTQYTNYPEIEEILK